MKGELWLLVVETPGSQASGSPHEQQTKLEMSGSMPRDPASPSQAAVTLQHGRRKLGGRLACTYQTKAQLCACVIAWGQGTPEK